MPVSIAFGWLRPVLTWSSRRRQPPPQAYVPARRVRAGSERVKSTFLPQYLADPSMAVTHVASW